MKKIILAVSALFLAAQLTTAQTQDTTRRPDRNGGVIQQDRTRSYTDSSGKYAPYGDSTMTPGKSGKHRNKRDKVDSLNTQPPVIK